MMMMMMMMMVVVSGLVESFLLQCGENRGRDCRTWFNSSFRSHQMDQAILLRLPPPPSSILLCPPPSLHDSLLQEDNSSPSSVCFTVKLPAHLSEFISPRVLITNSHFNYPQWHRADLRSEREEEEEVKRQDEELQWIISSELNQDFTVFIMNSDVRLFERCVVLSEAERTAKETICGKMRPLKYFHILWTFWLLDTTNTEEQTDLVFYL